MKRECERVGDAIWEHARTGREFPDDVTRHVEGCPECTNALREAVRISQPLCAASSVPAAPDCRSAVMARISRRARMAPAVWAYACAVVLIAALGIVAALMFSPQATRPEKQLAQKVTPTDVERTRPAAVKQVPKEKAPKPVESAERTIQPSESAVPADAPSKKRWAKPEKRVKTWRSPAPKKREDPAVVEQPPVVNEPEPVPVEEYEQYDRPVALVVVTFPTGRREETESYGYTQRNTETGEVTKCSVTRSGNSIEIYLESTPGGDQPPVKGSLDYENNASA